MTSTSLFGRVRRRIGVAAVVIVATAAAACEDSPTSPFASLVTTETAAALRFDAALTRLPALLERARVAGAAETGSDAFAYGTDGRALDRASLLWERAMSEPVPERAAVLRDRAYVEAAVPLARRLGAAAVLSARDDVARWIEAAERALGEAGPAHVARKVADARGQLESAAETDPASGPAAVMLAVLRAGDRLTETTAEAVAERLIRDVEALLLGGPAAAEPDAVTRRRAERMLRGARDALKGGDVNRAIRRAFYAGQLLRME